MTKRAYFTDINKVRQPSTGLVRDAIPDGTRTAVRIFVAEHFPNALTPLAFVCRELDLDASSYSPSQVMTNDERGRQILYAIIAKAPMATWLDLVSALFYFLQNPFALDRTMRYGRDDWPSADQFRNHLNGRLLRHYSAFTMHEDGLMEESSALVTQAAIAEARSILTHPDLAGPDRQFQEAVLCLFRRPDPNPEAAVTNAMNAVESVLNLALGMTGLTLGNASTKFMERHQMHGALKAAMNTLYGYASDAGGRHGLAGEPDADLVIAEYVLHQAAAAIVFVARLEGWATVDSSSFRLAPTPAEPALATG